MKSTFKIESANLNKSNNLFFEASNLSIELEKSVALIEVRELDKRYTHANPKRGKCTLDCCSSTATHWLTRQNVDRCQSDMICHLHARIWMEVRNLVASEDDDEQPSMSS